MSTGPRTTIAELTLVLWSASWLSLFTAAGLALIAWFVKVDLAYYLAFFFILSSILRSLSEAASEAICKNDQNTMANSLKQYVSAENAATNEAKHRHLGIAGSPVY